MNAFWLRFMQASMTATQALIEAQQLLLRQTRERMSQGRRRAWRLPEAAVGERMAQAARPEAQGAGAQRIDQGGAGREAGSGRRRAGRRASQAMAGDKPRGAPKRGGQAAKRKRGPGLGNGRRKAR